MNIANKLLWCMPDRDMKRRYDWFLPLYYKARHKGSAYWYGVVVYGYPDLPSRCEWIVPGNRWLP